MKRPVVLLSLMASFAPASPSSGGGLSSSDIVGAARSSGCSRPGRWPRSARATRGVCREHDAGRGCDQGSPAEPVVRHRRWTFHSDQDGELCVAIQAASAAPGSPDGGVWHEILAIRVAADVLARQPSLRRRRCNWSTSFCWHAPWPIRTHAASTTCCSRPRARCRPARCEAQPYLAQWVGEHPNFRVARWHCAWPDQEDEKG